MGVVDDIKKNAKDGNYKIQSSDEQKLEGIFNRMFFTEHDIEEETKFIHHIMTRGLETQERVGLHCSSVICGDNTFCLRQQVLSLFFKQLQNEHIGVVQKRIFEEGNAIHEKWQRLFIRAGYAKAKTLDRTRFDDEYFLSYTPDIVCRIPEFFEGAMVGEIKSVNSYVFKKMQIHASARKQLLMYMAMCIRAAKKKGKWNGKDYTKGFVLCDSKNDQEFRVFLYDVDYDFVVQYIQRLEEIAHWKNVFEEERRMPKRHKNATSYDCKLCSGCMMKDACWNKGSGRVKL